MPWPVAISTLGPGNRFSKAQIILQLPLLVGGEDVFKKCAKSSFMSFPSLWAFGQSTNDTKSLLQRLGIKDGEDLRKFLFEVYQSSIQKMFTPACVER